MFSNILSAASHRAAIRARKSGVGWGLLLVLMLAACGEDSHHFKIEGRLLQMNQGQFFIYSSDATINGIDTIEVQGGRFAYEIPCSHPATLTMVFPNFSEVPIFAEPGKTANIDGDASHLKMLKITGSKTNELMSSFREQIANDSPPETARHASQFIADHPESPIGVWLLRKYFVATPNPDYKEAARLIKLMQAKQPENGALNRVAKSITAMRDCAVGCALPSFTVYDINGRTVSSSALAKGTTVICTCASWNYNSTDILRQLSNFLKDHGSVQVVAFSVDASKSDCRNFIRANQIDFPMVCTGEMFDTKPLQRLGLLTVPGNIVVRNGKIVARDLARQDLMKQLEN